MNKVINIFTVVLGFVLIIIPTIIGFKILIDILSGQTFSDGNTYLFRMFSNFDRAGTTTTPLFFGLMALSGVIILKNQKSK
ncbi:hypothetical protein [Aquimarina algiphila]|uniref:hypothetical protein n=1 Tax=Aquimarina algiphila TaxID=2047982 RepID=UPI002330ABA6|nr:hypothetical protein [Aquimarina algiphila]